MGLQPTGTRGLPEVSSVRNRSPQAEHEPFVAELAYTSRSSTPQFQQHTRTDTAWEATPHPNLAHLPAVLRAGHRSMEPSIPELPFSPSRPAIKAVPDAAYLNSALVPQKPTQPESLLEEWPRNSLGQLYFSIFVVEKS